MGWIGKTAFTNNIHFFKKTILHFLAQSRLIRINSDWLFMSFRAIKTANMKRFDSFLL